MLCPQCGHQQVSLDTRFCSRCGMSLSLITDLLANGDSELGREKREIRGIGLTMATVFMLLSFIIVFGIVTLPHLANPVSLWIWISFVIGSLIVGGFGLTNLILGGFFERLKERESRQYLMKYKREHQVLPEDAESVSLDAGAMPRLVEPASSVTEMTTRELEAIPKSRK